MKIRKQNKVIAAFLAVMILLAPLCSHAYGAEDITQVYLGGMPFGVKFYTGTLIVSGISEVDSAEGSKIPARDAGIQENDIILKVNGKEMDTAEDVAKAVEDSDGKPISFTCRRGDEEFEVSITPVLSESTNKYRIGIWMKDSTAGIGTVTYIISDTGGFGGLGHGICSSDGNLLKIERGIVTDISISGINKGAPGAPGELHGFFSSGKTGTVTSNTECGVFGVFSDISPLKETGTLINIGTKDKIHDGEAVIRCTLDDNTIEEYTAQIIIPENSDAQTKNFTIKITDPKLVEKTGGIVQGMSGSPIIQDDLLVGAVTHVLVSDSTEGYGIYIENMLGEMPEILK